MPGAHFPVGCIREVFREREIKARTWTGDGSGEPIGKQSGLKRSLAVVSSCVAFVLRSMLGAERHNRGNERKCQTS